MANNFLDVFCWIQNLPPISEWETSSMSLSICSSSSSCQPRLNLTTSKPFKPISSTTKNTNNKLIDDEETIYNVFANFIQAILLYGSNKNSTPFIRFPNLDSTASDNLSDFTYMKLLLQIFVLAHNNPFRTPCPLFSYAFSTIGLWKVQLYCHLMVMDVENSKSSPASERLQFSLRYHHVEGVLQFNHKVLIKDEWAEIMVDIDNVRCDVIKLVNEFLMKQRGAGAAEKHFPSRISLQLTPTIQDQVLSLSVGKSSENPRKEIGVDKSVEASFEASNPLALKVSAGESPQPLVYGYSANLNWFLHDSVDGKEVLSSKPSKFAMLNPKSWFKNRYSSAY
ncbi:hypothetical protein D0Y65_047292, partial [Glycine soja]